MRTALLIPCYKAKRFLPRLHEHLARLKPTFDEVILADDASNDGTAELAESLGFRLIKLEHNRGPGGARNALVAACTADWIHFHDVDDELALDYLAHVHPATDAESDVVIHFVDFLSEETRKLLTRWTFDGPALLTDPANYLLQHPMPTQATFLRREFFLSVGGFDEKHRCFEDGDFLLRGAVAGARIQLLPEVLEFSLKHAGGLSANEHYCFECRVEYLEGYAQTFPARLHAGIAVEAERAASILLRDGDGPHVDRALALCRRFGHRVPATSSVSVKLLRAFLPAKTVLGWQDRRRTRLQTGG